MDIELQIKKKHLDYLRFDFGYDGFNQLFRQMRCISFLRWLSKVIRENKGAEPEDLIQVELSEHHLDMVVHALSIVTYQTLCETLSSGASSEYIEGIEAVANKLRAVEDKVRQESLSEQGNNVGHLTREQFAKLIAEEIQQIYQEVLDFGNNFSGFKVKPKEIAPKLVFNFKAGTSVSFARGTQVVSLSLSPFLDDLERGKWFYWEYKSIRANKPIGEFTTQNWKLPLYALTCHELAHSFQMAIQRDARMVDLEYAQSMDKPHGKGWQGIYKDFRDQFVNRELYPEMFAN